MLALLFGLGLFSVREGFYQRNNPWNGGSGTDIQNSSNKCAKNTNYPQKPEYNFENQTTEKAVIRNCNSGHMPNCSLFERLGSDKPIPNNAWIKCVYTENGNKTNNQGSGPNLHLFTFQTSTI